MDKERDFEYCMVGNIIDKHYFGEQKLEIRRGTKQFRPNAKYKNQNMIKYFLILSAPLCPLI